MSDLATKLTTEHRRDYGRGAMLAKQALGMRRILDVEARLDGVKAQIDKDGVMLTGSMGQSRAHPLLTIEANLRAELAAAVAAWPHD